MDTSEQREKQLVREKLKASGVRQLSHFFHFSDVYYSSVCYSLVPRPHPLTRRNGLVNQVEFLGLTGALATV